MVSLVCGIASWLAVPFVGAIVAVITGHMARGQIKETGEDGDAMAVIGLVLGYLHLALVMIGILVVIAFMVFGIGIAAWGHHGGHIH